jgi:hypothetical protein
LLNCWPGGDQVPDNTAALLHEQTKLVETYTSHITLKLFQ